MAQFQEEKLIPLLRVTRKLLSCDADQRLNALQQMDQIFQLHEMSFSLMNIVVSGLCTYFKKIPNTVYSEMESIMPSDKQLNLKDSVYESRLVNTEEQSDEDETEQSISKETLPLTLLRIPTDLQCHLFNFLDVEELAGVQTVCRALCIAARNPSSLYYLKIPSQSLEHDIVKEVYSQPRMLLIDAEPNQTLVCNAKWSEHVTNLMVGSFSSDEEIVFENLRPFRKLRKCMVWRMASIFLDRNIISYDTLKDMCLIQMPMTEDLINEIQKFHNLSKLSIGAIIQNSDRLLSWDPISLPKLKIFSFRLEPQGRSPQISHYPEFRDFQRILIGSHPETVIVEAQFFSLFSENQIHAYIKGGNFALDAPKVPVMQQLNIQRNGSRLFVAALSQWIRCSKCINEKLIDELKVAINLNVSSSLVDEMASDIITLFRCSRKSKLKLCCDLDSVSDCNVNQFIDRMLDAPKDTFDEIEVDISCHPMYERFGTITATTINNARRIENALKNIGETTETLQNIFTEKMKEAEDWLTPWLVFDGERMKQIGLQKLNVTFECNLDGPYEADIFEQSGRDLAKNRASRWNNDRRKCIRSSVTRACEYTVTLCLCN